jgi:hypothetical protein
MLLIVFQAVLIGMVSFSTTYGQVFGHLHSSIRKSFLQKRSG